MTARLPEALTPQPAHRPPCRTLCQIFAQPALWGRTIDDERYAVIATV
ncbi:hypothetical protein [Acrocarpospora macrocephala]|nr:hypothetical protein [Acrocarpospora macrocephala]